ncbi:MAG: alpha-L-rhamnosidase, partial [Anaerolineae bacterium]
MPPQSSPPSDAALPVAVREIRFEHRRQPVGIGAAQPRLSWLTESAAPGWRQAAYQVALNRFDGRGTQHTDWVESCDSVLVPWPFAALRSREQVQLRLRVRGADNETSPWSEPATVEAGLLHPDDWTARFVTPDWDEDITTPQPCPLLRRDFDVKPGITRARLYVTALGLYEAQLNGAVVG